MILKVLYKISDYLDMFAKGVCIVFLSLMTIVMIAEVIWRNVFMSITWSEEVTTTFLGTWFIFVGAAVPLKRGLFVSIQFVRSRFPIRIANSVIIVQDLLILSFLLVGIIYGIDLVNLTMNQPSPALMYPMGYAYLGVVVGCMVMFYQTTILLLQRIVEMAAPNTGAISTGSAHSEMHP